MTVESLVPQLTFTELTVESPLSDRDRPKIALDLLRSLHLLEAAHHSRLWVFMGLYSFAAAAAWVLATHWGGFWCLWACVPLYILAAAALHGISLFTHEGVHSVLSPHPHWNRGLSMVCAIPVLQNYAAYKVLHLKHHKHLGAQGDPDHYKNYTHWSWLVFLMHWGRLLVGYPVYIIAIPLLGFWQGNRRDRLWIGLEVILLGLLIAGVVLSPIPRSLLVHGWLIPMLLINGMVNIRGMSQHTLLEHETDLIRGTRTLLTNPVTRFFMCNENYHLEHHLYPAVPWYHLPQLHKELQAELESRGAPYLPSYFDFVREFVVASIRRTSVGSVALVTFQGEKQSC
ncbi:fatty acid desaturase [Trichocoleus desertorum AS-A10]|uniref:fatty acid desaturase family protein n=1 Tax=Trichocoleus desertorum TaxID=1481672 RepID=UPI0032973D2F